MISVRTSTTPAGRSILENANGTESVFVGLPYLITLPSVPSPTQVIFTPPHHALESTVRDPQSHLAHHSGS